MTSCKIYFIKNMEYFIQTIKNKFYLVIGHYSYSGNKL